MQGPSQLELVLVFRPDPAVFPGESRISCAPTCARNAQRSGPPPCLARGGRLTLRSGGGAHDLRLRGAHQTRPFGRLVREGLGGGERDHPARDRRARDAAPPQDRRRSHAPRHRELGVEGSAAASDSACFQSSQWPSRSGSAWRGAATLISARRASRRMNVGPRTVMRGAACAMLFRAKTSSLARQGTAWRRKPRSVRRRSPRAGTKTPAIRWNTANAAMTARARRLGDGIFCIWQHIAKHCLSIVLRYISTPLR